MNTDIHRRRNVDMAPRNVPLWLIVVVLLILRLVVLTGATIVRSPEATWADPVFQIGTYVLTLVFLWLERARLSDFHMDGLVLWLIVLFKPVQTLILTTWDMANPMAFPQWPSLIVWVAAAALIVAFAFTDRNRLRVARSSVGWFGWGLGAGAITAVVLAYPMSLQLTGAEVPATLGLYSLLSPMSLLYQIGYAAVSEEPLFRGILWGMLRRVGWRDMWIWAFQAALFVLAHAYYFGVYTFSLWIIVPVGALVLGGLAWRSRTIASTIAAHAMMNTWGYTMGMIMYSWLHR